VFVKFHISWIKRSIPIPLIAIRFGHGSIGPKRNWFIFRGIPRDHLTIQYNVDIISGDGSSESRTNGWAVEGAVPSSVPRLDGHDTAIYVHQVSFAIHLCGKQRVAQS
jgi:hypothetical protein